MKYFFTNESADKKLLTFLSESIDGVTLNVLKRQLKLGEIRVNKQKVKENLSLSVGDEVSIFLPQDSVKEIEVPIVYVDENVVVVNKPSNTDVENNLTRIISSQVGRAVYPVHRLDRNTKGLVIFALDSESERLLCAAIKSRMIIKKYKALLFGRFDKNEFTDVAYSVKDPKTSKVKIYPDNVTGSKKIVTRFKVLAEYEKYSEVEITLITGRTHQIRAHAAYLGHPVLGDGKYSHIEETGLGYAEQQLTAFSITFGGLKGKLRYLNGTDITL